MEDKLKKAIELIQNHLFLPNPDVLLAVLGAAVGNLLSSGPVVWMMIVGPSGSGKSKLVSLLNGHVGFHDITQLTLAGLLSGVATGDTTEDATGGVLMEIGMEGRGVLVVSDFSNVLDMPRQRH